MTACAIEAAQPAPPRPRKHHPTPMCGGLRCGQSSLVFSSLRVIHVAPTQTARSKIKHLRSSHPGWVEQAGSRPRGGGLGLRLGYGTEPPNHTIRTFDVDVWRTHNSPLQPLTVRARAGSRWPSSPLTLWPASCTTSVSVLLRGLAWHPTAGAAALCRCPVQRHGSGHPPRCWRSLARARR